jgi:drug/metabolite transporter (DMT)-like permease
MIYVLLLITLSGTVAAQLLLKKGLIELGRTPSHVGDVIPFFLGAFTNIYVLGAMLSVLVAALAWIVALSRVELGHVYPFMGLSFVLVALLSALFFKENIAFWGWIGIVLVCVGVFLVLRS